MNHGLRLLRLEIVFEIIDNIILVLSKNYFYYINLIFLYLLEKKKNQNMFLIFFLFFLFFKIKYNLKKG